MFNLYLSATYYANRKRVDGCCTVSSSESEPIIEKKTPVRGCILDAAEEVVAEGIEDVERDGIEHAVFIGLI